MVRRLMVGTLACMALAGCGSTGASLKNLFKSNEAGIAALAPLATGPGCQAAASTLQAGENQIICKSLQSCDAAFCAAAVTPVPTVIPLGILTPTPGK